jgi:hypothetical protein
MVLCIAGGIVATGAIFTYYMQTNNENAVGKLFTITENSTGTWAGPTEMGDYDITWNPSGLVGGDTARFNFNITLSSDADASHTVKFTLTETPEVSLTIAHGGTEVPNDGTVTFTPGETIKFTYTINVDNYASNAKYNTSCLIETDA